jgi:hypothetical protein
LGKPDEEKRRRNEEGKEKSRRESQIDINRQEGRTEIVSGPFFGRVCSVHASFRAEVLPANRGVVFVVLLKDRIQLDVGGDVFANALLRTRINIGDLDSTAKREEEREGEESGLFQ